MKMADHKSASMTSAAEALGMTLPGAASMPGRFRAPPDGHRDRSLFSGPASIFLLISLRPGLAAIRALTEVGQVQHEAVADVSSLEAGESLLPAGAVRCRVTAACGCGLGGGAVSL
jgi:hypothetical protein